MLHFYFQEQVHTSKIKEAFEMEAAKQLHAHLHTKDFESDAKPKTHTDEYICKAISEWMDAHAETIFQEQAKTVLKEDFVDILENLILPGDQTGFQFKIQVNPLALMSGGSSFGVGVGVLFMNPVIGLTVIVGGVGIVIGGFLYKKWRINALRDLKEMKLREYIRECTQNTINKRMETFFKADVMKNINALQQSIGEIKVEVDKYKTQEAKLKSLDLDISKCLNELENIKRGY